MQSRSTLARLAVLVVALGLATAACGKYSIGNLRALMAFQDGNKLYQRQQFTEAIERYEAALKHNPDLGVIYFFIGNSYDNLYKPARKGEPANDANLQKAVDNYKLATQKIKDEEIQGPQIRKLAYEYLIAAYGSDKINDFAQAEPIAKQMISMDPNEPVNYQFLGKLYEDAGRYEDAEAMYQKSVEVRKDANGYRVMAGYFNRQGQFEKTMAAFENASKLEPNNPEAYHTMASYYSDKVRQHFQLSPPVKKDYVMKGLALADKALQLNPDYVEAMIYKGILLRQQATLEKDQALIKRLLIEADEIRAKGIATQKKLQTSSAATATGKGGK